LLRCSRKALCAIWQRSVTLANPMETP
jgi:hypothetical protein